jgi:hypothetical protein
MPGPSCSMPGSNKHTNTLLSVLARRVYWKACRRTLPRCIVGILLIYVEYLAGGLLEALAFIVRRSA